jgi:HEAT repeat protein
MTEVDKIIALIEKSISHSLSDNDVAELRRVLLVSGQGNVLQIGKYNIHIEQGQNLHIGDHIYQGPDVETLRQVMREVQAEIASDRYAASLQEYFRSLRRYCAELPYLTLTDIRPPKNLDEVYLPLRVRQREEEASPRKPAAQGASLTVEQVLHQAQTPHLLILGQPGAGKSTLLRQLAERAYDAPHAIGLDCSHLPLLLPLRALAHAEGALEERLNQALQNELRLTHPLPAGFLDAWPQQLDTPWLFLLDGLDEVPADRYLSLKQWIGDLLAHPNIARVILTSRPSVYTEKEWESSRLSVYEIQPFTRDQTAELARRWFGEDASGFLQALETVRSSVLTETPLLVTIAAKVYLERKRLPERRAQLYQEFVDIWLDEARERGLGDELDAAVLDLAQPTLAHLALAMTEHPEWMDEKSLIPVVTEYLNEQLNLKARASAVAERFLRVMARRSGVFLKREERYEWVHPTFREYFAALALNQQLESGKSFDEVLGERALREKWEEAIVVLAEVFANPAELVKWLTEQVMVREANRLSLLAYECWKTIGDATARNRVQTAIVDALITTLRTSAPETQVYERRYASYALGIIKDDRAVEPLADALLHDPFGSVRFEAAKALGEIGNDGAVPSLIAALGDRDYWVRGAAALALGKIRDQRSVIPLIAALADRHWDVRNCSAIALAMIGDPVVEPLITFLQQLHQRLPKVFEVSRGTEGELRLEISGEELLELLFDDSDTWQKLLAARILGYLEEPRALLELERLAREDAGTTFSGERVADAAREAIARIRARMAQTNQQGDEL